MINTLRLTRHILFYVVRGYMFRSSLTIIRPIRELCFTSAGYILGSHYVYNYVSVYTCYINTLKSGDGIVNGTVRHPQEHTQHPHIIPVPFTIPSPDFNVFI